MTEVAPNYDILDYTTVHMDMANILIIINEKIFPIHTTDEVEDITKKVKDYIHVYDRFVVAQVEDSGVKRRDI